MEFRENLKRLRKERGLTQAELAEQLFVSRSAVAKWENGLGLPSEETMAALEEIFGVPMQEIATKEPETVIVEKNRRLHLLWQITSGVLTLALIALSFVLPIAIVKGEYGFTPGMLASGDAYIDTGDYRIYHSSFFSFVEEQDWFAPQSWQIVKKHFWGCTRGNEDAKMQVIAKDNYVVGRLFTIKGKNGYYNLIRKPLALKIRPEGGTTIDEMTVELMKATLITIDGVEYPLDTGFFFITDEPVEYFRIDGEFYDIID